MREPKTDHDFVGEDELCGFVAFDHFITACALNEPVVRCGRTREAHLTETIRAAVEAKVEEFER